jgi:hypothetical protein
MSCFSSFNCCSPCSQQKTGFGLVLGNRIVGVSCIPDFGVCVPGQTPCCPGFDCCVDVLSPSGTRCAVAGCQSAPTTFSIDATAAAQAIASAANLLFTAIVGTPVNASVIGFIPPTAFSGCIQVAPQTPTQTLAFRLTASFTSANDVTSFSLAVTHLTGPTVFVPFTEFASNPNIGIASVTIKGSDRICVVNNTVAPIIVTSAELVAPA